MLFEEIDNISDLCHQQRSRHSDGVGVVLSADDATSGDAPAIESMSRVPAPLVAAAKR